MNSIVTLPLAGIPVAAASIDPDAELVTLADRLKSLHLAVVEASERLEKAGERYDEIKPEKSQALIWRPADAGFVSPSPNTPYCTDESVDALRDKEFVQWEFAGTNEELEELNPMYLGTSVLPVPGHEHRFISRPDEWRRRRAAELVAELDEYRAATAAAIEQCGLPALEEALDALFDERREIVDRMIELGPKTLRGLQALASGIVYAEGSWNIDGRPPETAGEEIVMTIIRALCEGNLAAA